MVKAAPAAIHPPPRSIGVVAASAVVLLTTLSLPRPLCAEPATDHCVVLTVANVRSAEGTLWVSVFADEASYRASRDPAILRQVAASEGSMEIRLCGLPAGTYAISTFHDENANGALDTTRIGLPVEGYGFSGGAKGRMGLPGFERIAFDLSETEPEHTERIELLYFF